MTSLFEELGRTYTLGKDGMFYPNLMIEETEQYPIGRWGWMHKNYLETNYPDLYQELTSSGTLEKHLADANERAIQMLEHLTVQMVRQEGITEQLKAEQPMMWVGIMNNIRSRAEEIVRDEVVNTL